MSETQTRKLLTIITEAALERTLGKLLEKHGAHGYTVTNARGKGDHGMRDAGWDASSNIRMEVICDQETADALVDHLQEHFYPNYAMVLYLTDVQVLRPDKF